MYVEILPGWIQSGSVNVFLFRFSLYAPGLIFFLFVVCALMYNTINNDS